MPFTLRVLSTRRHRSRNILGVAIEAGTFRHGDMAYVADDPEKHVEIVTSAFVDNATLELGRKTFLTIKEPSFPIEELSGKVLIDCSQVMIKRELAPVDEVLSK